MNIDPAILERVRMALEFARQKRFVAVAIDVTDAEALVVAVQSGKGYSYAITAAGRAALVTAEQVAP